MSVHQQYRMSTVCLPTALCRRFTGTLRLACWKKMSKSTAVNTRLPTDLSTKVEVAEEDGCLGAGDDKDDEDKKQKSKHVIQLMWPDQTHAHTHIQIHRNTHRHIWSICLINLLILSQHTLGHSSSSSSSYYYYYAAGKATLVGWKINEIAGAGSTRKQPVFQLSNNIKAMKEQ